MKFMHVFQGKFLVILVASLTLIGGATAVFASTSSAGRDNAHAITHTQSTATMPDSAGHKNKSQSHDNNTSSQAASCPGLPEVNNLATEFALGTGSIDDAVQAICALHEGTFKGTTPGNASVTSSRVFGFGEIEMLLTYGQFLAGHDKANAAGKLTSTNARSYLAQALQSCGTGPLETCLKTNIPGFKPGTSTGNNNSNNSNNNDNTGDQRSSQGHNNNGKPTSTPTPHH